MFLMYNPHIGLRGFRREKIWWHSTYFHHQTSLSAEYIEIYQNCWQASHTHVFPIYDAATNTLSAHSYLYPAERWIFGMLPFDYVLWTVFSVLSCFLFKVQSIFIIAHTINSSIVLHVYDPYHPQTSP